MGLLLDKTSWQKGVSHFLINWSVSLSYKLVSYNPDSTVASKMYVCPSCKWSFATPQKYLQPAKSKVINLGFDWNFWFGIDSPI